MDQRTLFCCPQGDYEKCNLCFFIILLILLAKKQRVLALYSEIKTSHHQLIGQPTAKFPQVCYVILQMLVDVDAAPILINSWIQL